MNSKSSVRRLILAVLVVFGIVALLQLPSWLKKAGEVEPNQTSVSVAIEATETERIPPPPAVPGDLPREIVTGYYMDFEGYPIELVLDDRGVALRISVPHVNGWLGPSVNHFSTIDFLKREVEWIVSNPERSRLPGGMDLIVEGWPVWGPGTTMDHDSTFIGIHFADGWEIRQGKIVAKGMKERPTYFYPYELPRR